jgi:hypothetical protein
MHTATVTWFILSAGQRKISFAAMDNYVRNSPFGRPQSKPSSYIPLCSAVYVRRADNLPGLPETFHEAPYDR